MGKKLVTRLLQTRIMVYRFAPAMHRVEIPSVVARAGSIMIRGANHQQIGPYTQIKLSG
jgi:hypothetical protein